MRILKTLLIICGIGIFVFASFLAYVSLTDLKPNEEENLSVHNNQLKSFPVKEEIAITTFNIGYAGLDGDQDFFADGGKGSRASNQYSVVENLDSIIGFLDSTEPDIVLLQEVDQDSSRSHNIDQVEILKDAYPNFSYSYGVNYKVPWVPVPLKNPMGKVLSGIMTLSKYNISHASRYQLPVEEKWPVKLFELDRCFTESQIITQDG